MEVSLPAATKAEEELTLHRFEKISKVQLHTFSFGEVFCHTSIFQPSFAHHTAEEIKNKRNIT